MLIFNPAVAGSSDVIEGRLGYRSQWAGVEEAPRTFFISGHMNAADNRAVGLGLNLYGDITGPTRRQGAQLSYAYHLPFENNSFLGMGVSATLFQYRIDYSQLNALQTNDAALLQGEQSKANMDLNFGLFYYGEDFWISASALQLLEREVEFVDDVDTLPLERHYFAGAGYKFGISRDFDLEPSFFVKSISPIPLQFDVNARLIYDNAYWFGVGYRSQDAVNLSLGFDLNDLFQLSYSYDINVSDIGNYATGSHELGIGFRWDYKDTGLPSF